MEAEAQEWNRTPLSWRSLEAPKHGIFQSLPLDCELVRQDLVLTVYSVTHGKHGTQHRIQHSLKPVKGIISAVAAILVGMSSIHAYLHFFHLHNSSL